MSEMPAGNGITVPGSKMKIPVWALIVGGVGIVGFAVYQNMKGGSTASTTAAAPTSSNADLVSMFDDLATQMQDYINQILGGITTPVTTPPTVTPPGTNPAPPVGTIPGAPPVSVQPPPAAYRPPQPTPITIPPGTIPTAPITTQPTPVIPPQIPGSPITVVNPTPGPVKGYNPPGAV